MHNRRNTARPVGCNCGSGTFKKRGTMEPKTIITGEAESRICPGAFEIRAGARGRPVIHGHAAVFNSLSQDLGGFREKIAPGAFADSLDDNANDPVALFNHNPDHLLGRKSAGTLRLHEDGRGLHFAFDPPDTQIGQDLPKLIRRGDINKMSFGFRVNPGDQVWEEQPDGSTVRTLKRVRLLDVSPVTSAAYQNTNVAVREHRYWCDHYRETARLRQQLDKL